MTKFSGHGIQLQMSDMEASPEFTEIAQVENLTPPGWTQGTEAVPTHDDTAGGGVEKLADALYAGQPFTLTILHDPGDSTHDDTDGLMSKKGQSEATDFKCVYPDDDDTEVAFAAWVTEFAPQGVDANSGKLRTNVTFDPTGDFTIT
ncbi:MAG: hypothetical protein ACODAE_08395 [Gemmatimonadota bacterium]